MEDSRKSSASSVIEQLLPGSTFVRSRRLRGGIGNRMHVVSVDLGAERRQVVLRRYPLDEHRLHSVEHARYEFELLKLLKQAGVSAPEPIALDAEGALAGCPAMVLSYLPGGPLWHPRDLRRWVDELARAAYEVHQITGDRYDLSGLHRTHKERAQHGIERRRVVVADGEPLAREALREVERLFPDLAWNEPVLTHEDYWVGNTVWERGRLTGIIDWSTAALGDWRSDVALCRVDLVFRHSLEAADAFLAAYEARSEKRVDGLRFFDLMEGLGALLYFRYWLAGNQDAGLIDLTEEVTGARVREFIRQRLLDSS